LAMFKFIKILAVLLVLPVSVKANEIVDGISAANIIEEGMLLGRTDFDATDWRAINKGNLTVWSGWVLYKKAVYDCSISASTLEDPLNIMDDVKDGINRHVNAQCFQFTIQDPWP